MPTSHPQPARAPRRGELPLVVAAWLIAACLVLCWFTIPECSAAALAEAATEAATESAEAPPAEAAAQPVEATPYFTALSVVSAEASAAWYARVLGFKEARRIEMAGGLIIVMQRPGALLELVEVEEARSRAEVEPALERVFHLHGAYKTGYLVDDLDAAIERLAALEVPLRGKVIDDEEAAMRYLQVEDPDGNVIQLFQIQRP